MARNYFLHFSTEGARVSREAIIWQVLIFISSNWWSWDLNPHSLFQDLLNSHYTLLELTHVGLAWIMCLFLNQLLCHGWNATIGQSWITIYSWNEGRFNSTGLRIDERYVFPKESQRGKWILGRIKHLISTTLSIVSCGLILSLTP